MSLRIWWIWGHSTTTVQKIWLWPGSQVLSTAAPFWSCQIKTTLPSSHTNCDSRQGHTRSNSSRHTHEMASSRFSPHEKQCPNWESANSCSPPAAATLKYPQTFLLLRKFSSCTVPELGLKP